MRRIARRIVINTVITETVKMKGSSYARVTEIYYCHGPRKHTDLCDKYISHEED